MSAYEVFAEAAAGAAVITLGITLHPRVQGRLAARRNRRLDLDGRPPRMGKDEDGNPIIVERGRPPLAASVHDLTDKMTNIANAVAQINERTEQLTRNSGSTLADAIHRIEENLDAKHAVNQQDIAELRETAEHSAKQLNELKKLAGDAAMTASAAFQQGRRIAADINILTEAATTDHSEIWAALSDLGYDRRGGTDAL